MGNTFSSSCPDTILPHFSVAFLRRLPLSPCLKVSCADGECQAQNPKMLHPGLWRTRERSRKRLSGARRRVAKVRTELPSCSSKKESMWCVIVFKVPTTHDVMTLFHPGYPKSHIDILNLTLLGLQILLFFVLPLSIAKVFFFLYFAFWRIAYDVGLGWVLTKQSKKKWIVREMQKLAWLDEKRNPVIRNWIRRQLAGKMGKDYSFDVSFITINRFPYLTAR